MAWGRDQTFMSLDLRPWTTYSEETETLWTMKTNLESETMRNMWTDIHCNIIKFLWKDIQKVPAIGWVHFLIISQFCSFTQTSQSIVLLGPLPPRWLVHSYYSYLYISWALGGKCHLCKMEHLCRLFIIWRMNPVVTVSLEETIL
jgi:hypothetical protein